LDKATFNRRKATAFGLKKSEDSQPAPKLWQIMVLTTAKRKWFADKLLSELNRQIKEAKAVGIVGVALNDGDGSIGKKRNELLEQCQSEYCNFFDDDDMPNPNYVRLCLAALEKKPDVVSLTGLHFKDGKYDRPFYHSLKIKAYSEDQGGYYRYPNHLNIMKADIAKQFRFPDINFAEDTAWATDVFKSGLLKTEAEVPEPVYHYLFRSKK
jgi:glycosyltransferase involved in cell wall biosynthesis